MTTAAVEVVIGVIPSAKTKTGMFSTAAYTLVVTNYRLIFAESPGNGFVDPSQVRQLKVERKWRSAGSDDDNSQAYLRIIIETTAGKTTYDTDGETPNANDAKLLFSRTFGPLVR